jgi:Leucine-rich repeat (LRR) protein
MSFLLGLSKLSTLEDLDFSNCRSLKEIPEGLGGLTSLKKLGMEACEAFERFLLGPSNLATLEELDVSKFRSL